MAAKTSVEQPLWRALAGYRVLTLGWAVTVLVWEYEKYTYRLPAAAYMAVLAVWTLATLPWVSSARRCTKRFLAVDIGLAVLGILISPALDPREVVAPTLPTIWVAGPVLAFAIKGGWRWGAASSLTVGLANIAEGWPPDRSTLHNVLLVCISAIAIGYVVEVARASERTLARALQIEAATRERERLARDIHDSVLQVLAMVQRRGTAIGGEAEELGRLAGEQEVALRTLVSRDVVPAQSRTSRAALAARGETAGARTGARAGRTGLAGLAGRVGRSGRTGRTGGATTAVESPDGATGAGTGAAGGPSSGSQGPKGNQGPKGSQAPNASDSPDTSRLGTARSGAQDPAAEGTDAVRDCVPGPLGNGVPGGHGEPAEDEECDLRALLSPHSGARVSFAEPGCAVILPAAVARELAAAVSAALDNVRQHATGPDGAQASAWILLEDEPDAVLVTVRDDGPGIPAGRLADAEAEGRLGVALSIRGRLRDLGGSAEWVSVPGQGTEVELRVPKND